MHVVVLTGSLREECPMRIFHRSWKELRGCALIRTIIQSGEIKRCAEAYYK